MLHARPFQCCMHVYLGYTHIPANAVHAISPLCSYDSRWTQPQSHTPTQTKLSSHIQGASVILYSWNSCCNYTQSHARLQTYMHTGSECARFGVVERVVVRVEGPEVLVYTSLTGSHSTVAASHSTAIASYFATPAVVAPRTTPVVTSQSYHSNSTVTSQEHHRYITVTSQ
jgi:hypothetical protein